MTETTETAATTAAPAAGARKGGGGLDTMLLPQLKQVASGLGIKATGMRKGALIEAIKTHQSGQGNKGGQSGGKDGGRETAARTAAR